MYASLLHASPAHPRSLGTTRNTAGTESHARIRAGGRIAARTGAAPTGGIRFARGAMFGAAASGALWTLIGYAISAAL